MKEKSRQLSNFEHTQDQGAPSNCFGRTANEWFGALLYCTMRKVLRETHIAPDNFRYDRKKRFSFDPVCA